MKTGSFRTYEGPGRVSIARSAPRGATGYRVYRALAPMFDGWRSLPFDEYRKRYLCQLSDLDPKKVHDDLHRLAGDHEPVLLCWEKPPFHDRNWCHRRMAAEWFQNELGILVPEYGQEPQEQQPDLL